VKVVVIGATGRTGSLAAEVADERDGTELVGGIASSEGSVLGAPLRRLGTEEARELFKEADVAVDFSTPEATRGAAETAKETGTTFVTGTTALGEAAGGALEKAADSVPVVRSSNFARGVNIFWQLVEEMASLLPEADFEVTETHHAGKLDAPSGTALETVERIEEAVGERELSHGRHGESPRGDKIGVHARRAGDVVGEHEVLAAEGDESLTLAHRASDRRAFAAGALDAAEWALGREPGAYTMDDVLEDV